MAVELNPPGYGFIVDTNSYAGNFERELCAWVTGCIGECGVGNEIAEVARGELIAAGLWKEGNSKVFPDIIDHVADERGCYRPVSIYPNPKYFNDGYGGHHSIIDWGKPVVTERLRRSLRRSAGLCKDGPRDLYEERKKEAVTAVPGFHPAYMSVVIFLNNRPGDELLEAMCERAESYVGEFSIEGIRLVHWVLSEQLVYHHTVHEL